ncbi:MAG: ATP-binding cassette domain-containing protein, partial [Candidatus Sungbacteria bacterium]|nr:ATP-binding cassette domain-containing protein [Candidatus Sungbacteria bacterium]
MIAFQNVSKIYSPTSVALKNVSLHIEPKEFVSLVGPSGAGKSTVLKLLIAEEAPSDGRIFFDGVEVTN